MRFIKRKLFGCRIRYSLSLGRPSYLKALPVFLVAVLTVLFLIASPVLAVDSDGDGIDDVFDNCPDFVSGDTRDSDADGVGNPCDNCMLIANDQTDGDGDDIGDACDPRSFPSRIWRNQREQQRSPSTRRG